MLADDCATILHILVDQGPHTMEALADKAAMPVGRVNDTLTKLLLAGHVRPGSERVKGRKVTTYEYRSKER